MSNGFGLTAEDKEKGIHPVEEKMETLCPFYKDMDELFGKKAKITPLAQFDAQQSGSFNGEDIISREQDHDNVEDNQLEVPIEWSLSDTERDQPTTQSSPSYIPVCSLDSVFHPISPSASLPPQLVMGKELGIEPTKVHSQTSVIKPPFFLLFLIMLD